MREKIYLDSIPSLPPRIFSISLTDIQIASEEVSQQLLRLESHKSAGLDHVVIIVNTIPRSYLVPVCKFMMLEAPEAYFKDF